MNSSGAQRAASATANSHGPANRWAVLALLGVAQLMVVLDVTIVNIALPSAQRARLLLLGGKLGDLFGR